MFHSLTKEQKLQNLKETIRLKKEKAEKLLQEVSLLEKKLEKLSKAGQHTV